MFKPSGKAVFKPSVYKSSSHRRRGMPRWLVILFTGIIIGAGGYWFIETNYGPQRLSVEDSNNLRQQVSSLTRERQNLQSKVDEYSQQIDTAKADNQTIKNNLSSNEATIQELKQELALLKQSIPADPSGLPVGIRGADLNGSAGYFSYQLLLSKKDDTASNYQAQLEIILEGRFRNGRSGYSSLKPVPFTVSNFMQLKGEQTLEQDTLSPRKAVITIREIGSNRILGKRVLEVK